MSLKAGSPTAGQAISGTGAIVAAGLAIDSGGSVELSAAGNNFNNLAANVTNPGFEVTVAASPAGPTLTVGGTVAGVTGVRTDGGAINIENRTGTPGPTVAPSIQPEPQRRLMETSH